jgi:hypothetical protein
VVHEHLGEDAVDVHRQPRVRVIGEELDQGAIRLADHLAQDVRKLGRGLIEVQQQGPVGRQTSPVPRWVRPATARM